MKVLTGFIGTLLATVIIAWAVMLLAGNVYPLSYYESLNVTLIFHLINAYSQAVSNGSKK